VECFLVAASFWAFYFGSGPRTNRALLVLSGICAGLAFVTRETGAIVALFYGILFLLGRRVPRAYFFLIAGGFLAVLTIDTVYLITMTGDPLYRFHIAGARCRAIIRSIRTSRLHFPFRTDWIGSG
jgi:hypothetical protein